MTEKTRVMVTISNFVMLIFAIVSGVVFAVNWKSDVEHRISNNQESIINLEIDNKEIKNMQTNTQTQLVEIQTDLKWIRAYMESDR